MNYDDANKGLLGNGRKAKSFSMAQNFFTNQVHKYYLIIFI